jgi:hypothetical protein
MKYVSGVERSAGSPCAPFAFAAAICACDSSSGDPTDTGGTTAAFGAGGGVVVAAGKASCAQAPISDNAPAIGTFIALLDGGYARIELSR